MRSNLSIHFGMKNRLSHIIRPPCERSKVMSISQLREANALRVAGEFFLFSRADRWTLSSQI